ncbi:MAG: hypothetical protein ACERKD_08690 [Prolixibacteraceae bacterium]
MKNLLFITLALIAFACQPKKVELIDLHIHLKGDLSIDEAIKKSEKDGIPYGIAVNGGLGFPVQNDAQIDSFRALMRNYPQFYVGMQAEGREWQQLFSSEAIAKFDYVFTDAMTFTDAQGRRNRIWLNDETWIDDEEDFMDYLVKTAVKIISTEPINIYVNPTYLPEQMAGRYDQFWTTERMDQVIAAAKGAGVAIEINNRFKLPSEAFIKRAKAAGIHFTMGTNNIDKNFDGSSYTLAMIDACGLTQDDFWVPEKK